MFKKQILKNLLSTLLFGAIYSLISFIDKGYVEPDMIYEQWHFILSLHAYYISLHPSLEELQVTIKMTAYRHMTLYEAYKKKKFELSMFGLERGSSRSDYFCTPIGAKVIGWTGVDGIHCNFGWRDWRCGRPDNDDAGRYCCALRA